jgi:hypothetical protein
VSICSFVMCLFAQFRRECLPGIELRGLSPRPRAERSGYAVIMDGDAGELFEPMGRSGHGGGSFRVLAADGALVAVRGGSCHQCTGADPMAQAHVLRRLPSRAEKRGATRYVPRWNPVPFTCISWRPPETSARQFGRSLVARDLLVTGSTARRAPDSGRRADPTPLCRPDGR